MKNLQSRASRTTDKGWITRYKNELRKLESRLSDDLPAKWRNGEMLTELGDTYAELGDFEEAILRYREALAKSGPQERVPIRTVEQLANLEGRFAVQLSLPDEKGEPREVGALEAGRTAGEGSRAAGIAAEAGANRRALRATRQLLQAPRDHAAR